MSKTCDTCFGFGKIRVSSIEYDFDGRAVLLHPPLQKVAVMHNRGRRRQ